MKPSIYIAILILLASCDLGEKEASYIEKIPRLSNVPGAGISFVIPDEEGWMLFDPDGKGAMIARQGRSKIESYIISLDTYQQSVPKTEDKFKQLYQVLKQGETSPPRYNPLVIEDRLRDSKNSYCIDFYYLVEDSQPKKLPVGDDYMLLETMGFFAVHPNIPNYMVRVAYSYRYAKGHEDPQFKTKAKWVLEQLTFTNQ